LQRGIEQTDLFRDELHVGFLVSKQRVPTTKPEATLTSEEVFPILIVPDSSLYINKSENEKDRGVLPGAMWGKAKWKELWGEQQHGRRGLTCFGWHIRKFELEEAFLFIACYGLVQEHI